VEYIEVRCIDLNPYEPLGVTAEQLRVVDAFLLYCLLSDSPETPYDEYKGWTENQKRIVYSGRDPKLKLLRDGNEVEFKDWAQEILASSLECAKLLDQCYDGIDYANAVQNQFAKLTNPELTPSAKVLADLREGKSFLDHTLNLAETHRQHFNDRPLTLEALTAAHIQAAKSLADQSNLEESNQTSFDEYLESYYAQYHSCGCAGAIENKKTQASS